MARPAPKERPSHRCSECGLTVAKWLGQCPECQAWGSISEVGASRVPVRAGAVTSAARPIDAIEVEAATSRSTGIDELDRVLGGGLVAGAVVLLAGEPGAGKSTLVLDAAARAGAQGRRSLYVTGEESAAQVRLRAERTGGLNPHLWLAAETDLAAVLTHIDAVKPELLVVDSVQTIGTATVEGTAGGVTQIRAVTAALVAVAKERGIATVLVGHVTKDGSIAGPRLLEHLVDVVLHFEGDRHSTLRMVRAVKNRYGPADEVGCFALTGGGIEGLADPSGLFLSRRPQPVPGTCVTVTVEGRRPLLAEVQALVAKSALPTPRRAVSGLDAGRVAMVLAVTERRARVQLAGNDVYTATVGGMRLTEPATDLALALAVMSAAEDRPLPDHMIALGELGLSGELRPVPDLQRRLNEASRMGFRHAVVPLGSECVGPMKLWPVSDLSQAVVALHNMRRPPAPRQVGLTLAPPVTLP
ncbi:MAG: DNA repair protein RadA [Frankiaceae bacterium]|nr:DNA repair protein RadA [Frankiaceae bacterium]